MQMPRRLELFCPGTLFPPGPAGSPQLLTQRIWGVLVSKSQGPGPAGLCLPRGRPLRQTGAMTRTNHHSIVQTLCVPPIHPPPPPSPWQLVIFYCYHGSAFSKVSELDSYSTWFLSFRNEHPWFLRVFSWLDSSLLLGAEERAIVWMGHGVFGQPPTGGHLGSSHISAVSNEAAVHSTCRFLCGPEFSSPLSKYQVVQVLE